MENLPAYFLSQGVLGVAVLVLGLVIRSIYGELKEERKKNSDLQEARRLDVIETRDQVTTVLSGISQNLESISDKIEIAQLQGRRRK